MSETSDMLAECPDSVQAAVGAVQVSALWKTTVEINEGGGNLASLVQEEHLVVASESLASFPKKAEISITERAENGGTVHTRLVKWSRLKDDDRALAFVFLEKKP